MQVFILVMASPSKKPHTTNSLSPVLQNSHNRNKLSLNGEWSFIVDPYETGYRNHRLGIPHDEMQTHEQSRYYTFFQNRKPEHAADMVEYDFDNAHRINVPGDWNHQRAEWLLYEGGAWYRKEFEWRLSSGKRVFIRFEAVNYECHVYLNGHKLGSHLGGFDPFTMEVTNGIADGQNLLNVYVSNRREAQHVPNMRTDWWNYGGITRDVHILEVPEHFIDDYQLQLDPEEPDRVFGKVSLSPGAEGIEVWLSIEELDWQYRGMTDQSGKIQFSSKLPDIELWSPRLPKLYEVKIEAAEDKLVDRIGFRTITVKGSDILLNGEPIFLRGVSCHEEIPAEMRRAHSLEDAVYILSSAMELGCNFLRLAHYPHNEHMVRLADEYGILLWEEIPVYWGIDYKNPDTLQQAEQQLSAMLHRDKNRASVIIWSLANETPVNDERNAFLRKLKQQVLSIDTTRLISAALDRDELDYSDTVKKQIRISDPMAGEMDIVSCNEYLGWYSGTPDQMEDGVQWFLPDGKPFIVSEFGADALAGKHGDRMQRWTEEFQNYVFEQQLAMLEQIPSLRGITPWVLFDFRTPRRTLPGIQDGWNRKGLISDDGKRKLAFKTLKRYFSEKVLQFESSSPDSNLQD